MELSRTFISDRKGLVSADINMLGFEIFIKIEGLGMSHLFINTCITARLDPVYIMLKYRRVHNLEFTHLKNTKKK